MSICSLAPNLAIDIEGNGSYDLPTARVRSVERSAALLSASSSREHSIRDLCYLPRSFAVGVRRGRVLIDCRPFVCRMLSAVQGRRRRW